MNIDVSILNSSGKKLELLISGVETIEMISIAFQDGLRNHATGVLADSTKSVRKLESGNYILSCYPVYSGKRDRINAAICYELRRELLNPIKTTH